MHVGSDVSSPANHHRAADPIDNMCTPVSGVKGALRRSAMTFGHP
jgi:hypothetical protein